MSKSFSISQDCCYILLDILRESKPEFIASVARNKRDSEAPDRVMALIKDTLSQWNEKRRAADEREAEVMEWKGVDFTLINREAAVVKKVAKHAYRYNESTFECHDYYDILDTVISGLSR